MPGASGPPVAAAVELFRRLGYTVPEEGPEFRARRKWRTVDVTVLDDDSTAPALADGGRCDEEPGLRCYVTPRTVADAVRDRLAALDPACEWAVVGVESPEEYEVVSAP